MPSVPPKMSLGAQNVKTGPDTLGIAENESRHEKLDSLPSVPPKTSPDAQNMKSEPFALGTTENESGPTKYKNETRRTRHR
jgi:hypothetical protein